MGYSFFVDCNDAFKSFVLSVRSLVKISLIVHVILCIVCGGTNGTVEWGSGGVENSSILLSLQN